MAETLTAPVSAPAAPSTPSPAPTSAPSSTPASTATPTSTPASPSATDTSIPVEQRLAAGWQKAKEAVPTDGEAPTEAPEVEAEAATETPVEAAPEVVEEKPAEGEAAKEGEEKPVAAAEETPELDDGTNLSPQDFAKAVKDSPEVEKFLNEHPEIKGQLFSALRERSEIREIRQLIPDIDTARTVTQAAATFQALDNKFLSGTTKEGATGFLNSWAKEALMVDDKGSPIMGADGKYQFHPALTNILETIYENKLSVLEERAEQAGDERLKDALALIREVSSPPSPGLDAVPDDLKPYADSLTKRESAITAKEQQAQRDQAERAKAANTESIDRVESKAAESIQGQLQPLFTKAQLSKFESDAALGRIGEMVDEKLANHPLYQSILDSILMRPAGEEREKSHRAHLLKYANQFLGPIAAQVIRDAKAGTLERQTQRQSTVAAQTVASRTEPRSASITVPQVKPQNPKDAIAAIKKEHPDWDSGQIVAESFKRFTAAKTGR